jgi:protein-tyrosine phosphatase
LLNKEESKIMSECSNFRDVGETINLIADKQVMRLNCLFRGGSTDYVSNVASIGSPNTIINLRNVGDRNTFAAKYHHVPSSNTVEYYDLSKGLVRRWLNEVIAHFNCPLSNYPIFIHCSAGKDRTGIAIAALLKLLKIPDEWILEEYLMSEGKLEVELMKGVLLQLSSPAEYFYKLPNFERITSNLKTGGWQPKLRRD